MTPSPRAIVPCAPHHRTIAPWNGVAACQRDPAEFRCRLREAESPRR